MIFTSKFCLYFTPVLFHFHFKCFTCFFFVAKRDFRNKTVCSFYVFIVQDKKGAELSKGPEAEIAKMDKLLSLVREPSNKDEKN